MSFLFKTKLLHNQIKPSVNDAGVILFLLRGTQWVFASIRNFASHQNPLTSHP